jgi:hypothetical protein
MYFNYLFLFIINTPENIKKVAKISIKVIFSPTKKYPIKSATTGGIYVEDEAFTAPSFSIK